MIKVCLILVLTCIPYCFTLAVRNWGENCTHSDECFDHRMVCAPDDENVMRCLCDRFHKWNGSSVGCVQMYSISYIMNQMVVVHNNAERMEKLQERMFLGPVYSVYFMIFVIASCTLSVILYCLYIRTKDSHLKEYVVHLVTQSENRRRRTLHAQQSTSQC